MRKALFTVAVLLLLGSGSSRTQAALVSEVTQAFPDIETSYLSINYDATSGVLTATGLPQQLATGPNPAPMYTIGGATFTSYTLTAYIDHTGAFTGGTLTINGTIASLGDSSPLLTGNLTDFGLFGAASINHFEFTGTATGGSLSSMFSNFAIIATTNSFAYTGEALFGSNFSSGTSNGVFTNVADTFAASSAVPEPASLMAGLVMLGVGLGGRRRR